MNQDIWPDRAFFWGVCATILPDWTKKYYEAVQRKRHAMVSERVDKTKIIVISDAWRKRLTEFNYKPESKSTTIMQLILFFREKWQANNYVQAKPGIKGQAKEETR